MKNTQLPEEDKQFRKTLKKRFRKINDPNFSLFEEEYSRYKFMKRIVFIFIGIGLLVFALGLYLIIAVSILGIIPLTFGGLGVMMSIYLPIHLIDRAKFKAVLELKEGKQFDKLLELAGKYSHSYGYLEQEKAKLATYLLVDFKSMEIAYLLKNRIMHSNRTNIRDVLKTFYLLAVKLGYVDHISFFYALDSEDKPAKIAQKQGDEFAEPEEIVVPIMKVYFIEEIPKQAKCMVSGLELDFRNDEVVVCPFCSAWAKKNLLKDWLAEKENCPVCQRTLTINDCPTVKITKEEKKKRIYY